MLGRVVSLDASRRSTRNDGSALEPRAFALRAEKRVSSCQAFEVPGPLGTIVDRRVGMVSGFLEMIDTGFVVDSEKLARLLEASIDVGGGVQAVVTDLVKAIGQDVEQEATDELSGLDGAGLALADPEGNGLVSDLDETAVGDGDAMGIAGEVGQHVR